LKLLEHLEPELVSCNYEGQKMKRILTIATLCLAFCLSGLAQQNAADAPATKEDIQRYLDAMHVHDMMKQMIEAMSKPLHQMVHEQYMKDQDKLPADFETKMNKIMDDMMNAMPFDEMMEAMLPAYQKHFTKGDIDALIAFYSSPTGQKVLREMPAIMAESMEAAMPIAQKYTQGVAEHVQEQIAEMMKEPAKGAGKKATKN
jgi:hypothetical protein